MIEGESPRPNFCDLRGRGTCPTGRSGLPADLMHVCHLELKREKFQVPKKEIRKKKKPEWRHAVAKVTRAQLFPPASSRMKSRRRQIVFFHCHVFPILQTQSARCIAVRVFPLPLSTFCSASLVYRISSMSLVPRNLQRRGVGSTRPRIAGHSMHFLLGTR